MPEDGLKALVLLQIIFFYASAMMFLVGMESNRRWSER
jgi:hypothetical protein